MVKGASVQCNISERLSRPLYASAMNKRGFSMLEFALVFCIAGALMGGIYLAINDVRHKYQNEKLDRQVFGLVSNIRATFINTPNFNVPSDPTTLSNLFPSDVIKAGTSFFNAYGGTLFLTGAPQQFVISASGLPQQACIYMLTQRFGNMAAIAKLGILGLATRPNGISLNLSAPVTVPLAAPACAASNSNQVIYTFNFREPQ